jgi:hypothetical protein
MADELSFRTAQPRDFTAVRNLAEQLALHIEAPLPPLTLERFLSFYVNADGRCTCCSRYAAIAS